MASSGRTPCRALLAWWAVPQIVYLLMTFGFSLVPQATFEEYANAPLPTTPGPLWLYLVYGVFAALDWASPVLTVVLVVRATRRVWQSPMTPRAAWLAISTGGLAVEAIIWAGLSGFGGSGLLSGFPGWPALILALLLAAVGVAMLLVLRRLRDSREPEPDRRVSEPGQPDGSAAG
jgi:hypothetical protein